MELSWKEVHKKGGGQLTQENWHLIPNPFKNAGIDLNHPSGRHFAAITPWTVHTQIIRRIQKDNFQRQKFIKHLRFETGFGPSRKRKTGLYLYRKNDLRLSGGTIIPRNGQQPPRPASSEQENSLAPNFSVPESGYYELTADLNSKTWMATKTIWSVIGTATPGGWEQDTPMTYDAERRVWRVSVSLKSNGSFKFRANKAWTIDFGRGIDGNLRYADNPFCKYDSDLKEFTVPTDGTYMVVLDLHTPGKYNYSF